MSLLGIKIRCDIARWSIVKQFPRIPCKLLVTLTPHLPDRFKLDATEEEGIVLEGGAA